MRTNMLQPPVLRGSAAVALLSLTLASCSLMDQPWRQRQPEEPPAPVVPADPPPVATHRFEIEDNQDIVGVVQITTSSEEDTLSDIARRFNVGYEEIVRANPGVDPWLPGEGTRIVVPTQFILPNAPREGIVINIAAMRLFYFPPRKKTENGLEKQIVYTHPIGIGKVGWATPLGTTKVVRRQKDPTWRPTPSIIREHRKNGEELPAVVGPGPDNPLGRHALYLGWPSYLIHGTNKPAGVGLRSSHGCIRLYPEDIALLFENVKVGTPVRVVNQPFVFGWHEDQLYLQAYDVLEDDPRDWQKAQRKLLSKALATSIQKELKRRNEEVNWEVVSQIAHNPRGIPVPISQDGGSIEAVLAKAPRVQNRVPEGASWDGVSDLPVDEATFREMLSDTDPEQKKTQPVGSSGAEPAPATPGT
jgi:L,D-transpeptidase ErfK/SrfK